MIGLFDSRISVYRIDDESRRAGEYDMGEVQTNPVKVEENVRCSFQYDRSQSRDEGVGSRAGGWMMCLVDKKKDIRDADIIKITRGPKQSSEWWVVIGSWSPSRARWHRELKVQAYVGIYPTD